LAVILEYTGSYIGEIYINKEVILERFGGYIGVLLRY
jgi:hypothetical protein